MALLTAQVCNNWVAVVECRVGNIGKLDNMKKAGNMGKMNKVRNPTAQVGKLNELQGDNLITNDRWGKMEAMRLVFYGWWVGWQKILSAQQLKGWMANNARAFCVG